MLIINQIGCLPDTIDVLVMASKAEGYNFIKRLVDEYHSGVNRFDKCGEGLFTAYDGRELVGIGGVNIDPYCDESSVGRVRHLYVLPSMRGFGVGKLLMSTIEQYAAQSFENIQLYTDWPEASGFYVCLGYDLMSADKVSHRKPLTAN